MSDEQTPITSVDDCVAFDRRGEKPESRWAIGTEHLHGKLAALRVPRGDGQFVLFGADVVYRGQPVGTFKLLFNAIQGARSRQVSGVRGE